MMTKDLLRLGIKLRGSLWPEVVRVEKVGTLGDRINLGVVGVNSGKYYSKLIREDDLTDIEALAATGMGDATSVFQAIEALRIKLAYTFDPHFAVSVSQIDPLPHQLEAVYHYLLNQPQIRFLLADDPGAGKTIMAGLLLKELKFRGVVERTLIVCPASLSVQWMRELREKFGENFERVDRNTMQANWGRNIWEAKHQAITSIYWARKDEIRETLASVDWDLVIVDEAHKMAAYRYGQDKRKETEAYKLGKLLSERNHGLLLLTATPHKGDPDNFQLFLQLLDKDLLATPAILREATENQENSIFLRRLKEDMFTFDGAPCFPERTVKTQKYRITGKELELYEAVRRYFEEHYKRAEAQKKRNVGFALTVLQRRLASSLAAITRSLERREEKLKKLLQEHEQMGVREIEQEDFAFDEEAIEEAEDSERAQLEDRAASVTTAQNVDELKIELGAIGKLVQQAQETEALKTEKKWEELAKVMEALNLKGSDEKLLIFTEHRDTLQMLVGRIKKLGFTLTQIHGGMKIDDRITAEKEFWHTVQILVATEAAGEGINLQCCHLMVNYDIPWNPNRLEQRMGRIHRYLQKKPVTIFNLVAVNTREGEVLETLFDKLEEMRQALGSDRVYDVIGDVLEVGQVPLADLIKEAILNAHSKDTIKARVSQALDPKQRQRVENASLMALATRFIDMEKLHKERQRAKEQRLMPEYIERFFEKATEHLKCPAKKRKDGLWQVEPVHARFRDSALKSVRLYGKPEKAYRYLTFAKAERTEEQFLHPPELIGPGHPLFESVLELTEQECSPHLAQGSVFFDPEATHPYLLWFVRAAITDGTGKTVGERLFATRQYADGHLETISPWILQDLKPSDGTLPIPEALMPYANDSQHEPVVVWILEVAFPDYLDEIQRRRSDEADIKRKYLDKSFTYLINKEQAKLLRQEDKLQTDDNYRLAYEDTKRRYDELRERHKKRLIETEQEKVLSPKPPEILAMIAVRPLEVSGEEAGWLHRDEEVERIAMETAQSYEKQAGRRPEDVSEPSLKLGFDIRSYAKTTAEGVEVEVVARCIEVKGKKGGGPVLVTPNEFQKAARFAEDYYLYVVPVSDDGSAAKPRIFRNPARKLDFKWIDNIQRYLLEEQEWKHREVDE